MQFDITKVLNASVIFLLQFVALFAGGYVKEYFTLTKQGSKIKLGRIVVASMTISFLLVATSDWIIAQSSLELFFTGCFLLGVSGNKVIELVIDGTILQLFGKIFFKNITESVKEVMDERHKKEEEVQNEDKG